jgi:cysteine desulfurase
LKPQAVYYLDNSATTRVRQEAALAVMGAMTDSFGNPSSLHGLGLAAEQLVKKARGQVAALIGAPPAAIFFTSGGTEANNLAILGAARTYRQRGRHIITSATEHPSVLETCRALEREGFSVTYLPVDDQGRVSPNQVEDALTDETILVSIMHVNNEIGTIQPVEEIGRRLKARGRILFHIDAVQSAGKLPLQVDRLGCDLLTLSSHKIHGPKGIGALYVRPGLRLEPILHGGGQERGLRSGTENVPGIAGFGAAAQAALQELAGTPDRLRRLKLELIKKLEESGLRFAVNGPDPASDWAAPHVLNLSFAGVDRGEVLVHALEQHGVFVSTGSACHSKHASVSHVLEAIGCSRERSGGAIRISLSPLTGEAEIDAFVSAARATVPELAAISKGRKG